MNTIVPSTNLNPPGESCARNEMSMHSPEKPRVCNRDFSAYHRRPRRLSQSGGWRTRSNRVAPWAATGASAASSAAAAASIKATPGARYRQQQHQQPRDTGREGSFETYASNAYASRYFEDAHSDVKLWSSRSSMEEESDVSAAGVTSCLLLLTDRTVSGVIALGFVPRFLVLAKYYLLKNYKRMGSPVSGSLLQLLIAVLASKVLYFGCKD